MNDDLLRVAIVGAATLKGKELGELLSDRSFPADIRLLDDDESLGQLEAVGDEVSFIQSVRPGQFDHVDLTFFTSDEKFTAMNWNLAQRAGSAIVDLSYGLEDQPRASLRAPWIERETGHTVTPELEPGPVVVAHPAAVVLALLLLRAEKAAPMRAVVATVFEPASERGRRGMDELHEQTVNLLSFQQLPTDVFGTQSAFNLLARYGENSQPTLERVARRIFEHFKRLTDGRVPVPSLMLVHAPIFHGYAFSVYLELERQISLGDLTHALSGEHITVTRTAEESPTNVNTAGQEQVPISVRSDPQHRNGFWIWASADNLRIGALTAVECAESIVALRPKGKVQ
jgi:aspartate-semialdehyde dehydrogenase